MGTIHNVITENVKNCLEVCCRRQLNYMYQMAKTSKRWHFHRTASTPDEDNKVNWKTIKDIPVRKTCKDSPAFNVVYLQITTTQNEPTEQKHQESSTSIPNIWKMTPLINHKTPNGHSSRKPLTLCSNTPKILMKHRLV